MLDRINKILEEKQMSTTQFADFINIQRPTMSHIISGRNNPSLDIVTKILKSFPDINSDWLMFGEGKMYKNQGSINDGLKKESAEKSVSNESKLNLEMVDLFSSDLQEVQKEMIDEPDQQSVVEEKYVETNNHFQKLDSQYDNIHPQVGIVNDEDMVPYHRNESVKSMNSYINIIEQKNNTENKQKDIPENEKVKEKEILKIVFFYSDKSFSEYYPEK